MTDYEDQTATAGAQPVDSERYRTASPDTETDTSDPQIVRTTRPTGGDTTIAEPGAGTLHSSRHLAETRHEELVDRFGGFYWGADFLGFAVATFFSVVLLGIVATAVGAAGYQMGAHVPKAGQAVSQTTQNLGIGAVIGSLVALFLAYFIGGYAAGRMARYDGPKNGLGVVIWTVIIAILLGILGAVLGTSFNVASQLHLNVDPHAMGIAGVVSLLVTLAIISVAAILGGAIGEKYHRDMDREAGVAQ